MDPTDNHGLQIWEHGDRPWSHNEDMETIEQKLVVRDSAANRSDYTPYDGSTFIATDTGAIYDGDGSSWNIVTRGVGHLRLQSDDVASRVYYDEDSSGQPVHFQRDETATETALTFSGTNVGVGTATDPTADLEVGGELEVQGLLDAEDRIHLPNAEGSYSQIRASQNETAGICVRPSSNPSSGDAIFTVESTGSATRLFVAHNGESHFSGHLRVTRDLTVEGSKDFAHDAGNGSEIVYTAQESSEPRAVHEGQVSVTGGRETVQLPAHFTTVVSGSDPRLRVQVTPHSQADVWVPNRTPGQLTIETDATDDVTVDFRVTGVRDGYEEKQITREKPDRPGRGPNPSADAD